MAGDGSGSPRSRTPQRDIDVTGRRSVQTVVLAHIGVRAEIVSTPALMGDNGQVGT
ncbi:hypothetical protein MA5S1215_5087 [Mycobacteroides abscessus 5S-1215]|nr:hypothetical protein MA5S0708_5059 [Mycobacteroides abscessus 5S-0708]EIU29436.1 hypothetical protein MA5S1212_4380 [Mycobacteroides abscessus 5S-1212]EIU44776.1 hypothetical protein MA5S1215_5087 [Mycobacteroides abscessus 5S-1215]